MESAITTVVKEYLTSSKGKDGLNSANFRKLVKNQLGNIMSDTDSKSAVDDLMQNLDENRDEKVSFKEYLSLIGYLANTLSQCKAKSQTTNN